MSDTTPTSHYRLAPSSSSRWLECPGSALAELPDVPNVYGVAQKAPTPIAGRPTYSRRIARYPTCPTIAEPG